MQRVINALGEKTDPIFRRVFSDQFVTSEDVAGKVKVSIRPGKDVPTDSVQNVNDPEAGYAKKYDPTHGYTVQVAETFSDDPGKVNIITATMVTDIHVPDSECHGPLVLQSQRVTGNLPTHTRQDGGYWSAKTPGLAVGRQYRPSRHSAAPTRPTSSRGAKTASR